MKPAATWSIEGHPRRRTCVPRSVITGQRPEVSGLGFARAGIDNSLLDKPLARRQGVAVRQAARNLGSGPINRPEVAGDRFWPCGESVSYADKADFGGQWTGRRRLTSVRTWPISPAWLRRTLILLLGWPASLRRDAGTLIAQTSNADRHPRPRPFGRGFLPWEKMPRPPLRR